MKAAGLVWHDHNDGQRAIVADAVLDVWDDSHADYAEWGWLVQVGNGDNIRSVGVAKAERGAKAAAVRALLRLVAAEKRAAVRRHRDVRKAVGQ